MFRFSNHAWRCVAVGFITFLLMCPGLMSGCSGSSGPVDPPAQLETSGRIPSSSESNRALLGYYNLYFDEDRTSCELVPVRETSWHMNVMNFTEFFNPGGVAVTDFFVHPDDTFTVALLFTHPIGMQEYTIFDVRGILVMPAEHIWLAHEVNTPGIYPGESALLNADGYTRRWNPVEFLDYPVPFNYFDSAITEGMGKHIQTLVNPYIQYWTGAHRMYFEAGHQQTNHFHISLNPTMGMVGLAFDCSWEEPNDPGLGDLEIPASWPADANSYEPYAISVAGQEGQLECSVGLFAGGSANVLICVRDWQNDAYMPFEQVRLEIPELFEGFLNPWTGDGTGQNFIFEFNVINESIYEPTTLLGLFSIEGTEEDAFFVPDMPVTAYELITMDVVEVDPPMCNGSNAIHKTFGGSFTIANSYGNRHLDSSFLPVQIAGQGGLLFDGGTKDGTEYVQTALIPAFGGNTTSNTIITRSGYNAGNALLLQTNDYNGHVYLVSDSDPDNLLVYTGAGQLLREYDLGLGENGFNEPVCFTTNPTNGDIWMIGDKGTSGIYLERLAYLEQGDSFEYVFHQAAQLDLSEWLGENPQPLGIGINGHYKRLYLFHAADMGTIEMFDISLAPAVHDDKWSRSGLFSQEITPYEVDGIRKLIGGDLVIDHADGEIDAQCRILIFANTQGGGSRLTKLDAWCQTLGNANLGSPYSCMAINNYSNPADRCLVFFSMSMVIEYMVFHAPSDW